jgi:hypothetical protein
MLYYIVNDEAKGHHLPDCDFELSACRLAGIIFEDAQRSLQLLSRISWIEQQFRKYRRDDLLVNPEVQRLSCTERCSESVAEGNLALTDIEKGFFVLRERCRVETPLLRVLDTEMLPKVVCPPRCLISINRGNQRPLGNSGIQRCFSPEPLTNPARNGPHLRNLGVSFFDFDAEIKPILRLERLSALLIRSFCPLARRTQLWLSLGLGSALIDGPLTVDSRCRSSARFRFRCSLCCSL